MKFLSLKTNISSFALLRAFCVMWALLQTCLETIICVSHSSLFSLNLRPVNSYKGSVLILIFLHSFFDLTFYGGLVLSEYSAKFLTDSQHFRRFNNDF